MSDRTTVVVAPGEITTVLIDTDTVVLIQDRTTIVGSDNAGPQGAQGLTGATGPTGNPGVYVGPTPPADHTLLWVDTA